MLRNFTIANSLQSHAIFHIKASPIPSAADQSKADHLFWTLSTLMFERLNRGMTTIPIQPHPYSSPKRKRGEEDSRFEYSPSPSAPRLDTEFRKYPFPAVPKADDERDDGSPRAMVAGHFQALAIDCPIEAVQEVTHANKRFAHMSAADPARPQIQDSIDIPFGERQAFQPPTADTFMFEPRASSAISEERRSHTGSPPLDGHINDSYWHESEITGHDPADPNDDGYGINGIGFKPTPAIAWQRSQKRKQQLADYKSREAREARQRRSERRRVESMDLGKSEQLEAASASKGRVRFDDG